MNLFAIYFSTLLIYFPKMILKRCLILQALTIIVPQFGKIVTKNIIFI